MAQNGRFQFFEQVLLSVLSLLEGSWFTNLLSCFTVVVSSYTDSKMSVTLSIWNIIVLLSFKLSVKHRGFTEKLLKYQSINCSIYWGYTTLVN